MIEQSNSSSINNFHNRQPRNQSLSNNDSSSNKQIQPQSKKQRHNKSNATVYFQPRRISPQIMITHRFPNLGRIYECSNCGYNVVKPRSHKCTVATDKILFSHQIRNKKTVRMTVLIPQLRCQVTKKFMRFPQMQQYLQKYQLWLSRGRQANLIQNRRKPITKQPLINKNENQELEKFLDNQLLTFQQKVSLLSKYHVKVKTSQQYIEQTRMKQQKFALKIWQNMHHMIQTKFMAEIMRSVSDMKTLTIHEQTLTFSNIHRQLDKFHIPGLYGNWRNTIEDYIQKCSQQQKNKNNKYFLSKIKAAQFLKQIPPLFLQNKKLLIESFRVRPPYIQKIANSIIKQLKKGDDNLLIPDISANIAKKIVKKRVKKIHDIHEIKRHVYHLINQKMFVIAVDLWFAFCLGLRLKDLMRVKIKNQQGIYFDMIALVENKNRHETCRCIPSSLKILAEWASQTNTYPITPNRLKQLISYAKANLGGFYILRHSLLTETISGLMKQSGFKPHSSTQTTLKYYIDYTNYSLIDTIFDIKFRNSSQKIFQPTQSSIRAVFNQSGGYKEQNCSIPFQDNIYLPSKVPLEQEVAEDNFLIESIQNPQLQKYLQSMKICTSLQKKQQVAEKLLGSQECQIFCNIYQLTHCNYFKLLSSYLERGLIVAVHNVFVLFEPNQSYLINLFKKAQEMLQIMQIISQKQCPSGNEIPINMKSNYMFQTQNISKKDEQTEEISQIKGNESVVFLPKFSQKQIYTNRQCNYNSLSKQKKYQFLLGGKECNILKENPTHIIVLSQHINKITQSFSFITMENRLYQKTIKYSKFKIFNQQKSQIILKKSANCSGCNTLRIDLCDSCEYTQLKAFCQCEQQFIECECHKYSHTKARDVFSCYSCVNDEKDVSDIGLGEQQNLYQEPPFLEQQNNIKTTISKERVYIQSMGSSQSITSRVFLPWKIIPRKIKSIVDFVRKNQPYLPLSIQRIQNKGFSVIAVNEIPKNTIICVYIGIVRPHTQCQILQNHLLPIGWFQRTQYYISCIDACNVGKFINHTQSSHLSNCILEISLLGIDNFCPFFRTTKKIQKGQQLLWNYREEVQRNQI